MQLERSRPQQPFEALDAKIGVILGFASVLIALSPDVRNTVPLVALIFGLVAAGTSAVFAVMAFWPRDYPVLEVGELRRYLPVAQDDSALVLFDTLVEMAQEGANVLQAEAHDLRIAIVALTVAEIAFGLGILVSQLLG